jgi:hypothetical protein
MLMTGDQLLGTYMAPQIPRKPAKEEIIVQELGSSATSEGSRKRRKSIHITPSKVNGNVSSKTDVEVNGTMDGSPRGRKVNGTTNGIGSRGK